MKKIMAGYRCEREVGCVGGGTCTCSGVSCRGTETGCEADQADGTTDICTC